MNLKVLGFILLMTIASSECSRILFIQPSFSKSHVMPLQTLAKELANHGHEITFLSMYPFDKKIENYRDIKLEVEGEFKTLFDDISKGMSEGIKFFKVFPLFQRMVFGYSNHTINSPVIQKLMKEEKFDLVVIGYFLSEFLLGFADHFKCPSVIFTSSSHVSSLMNAIGNPLSPEGTFSAMSNSKETNFINRVKNYLIYVFEFVLFRGYFYYQSKSVYE